MSIVRRKKPAKSFCYQCGRTFRQKRLGRKKITCSTKCRRARRAKGRAIEARMKREQSPRSVHA